MEELDELKDFDKKPMKEKVATTMHRLGESVGDNGFKWWGQPRVVKQQMTAMFICPHCEEANRMRVYPILASVTKSCGCLR